MAGCRDWCHVRFLYLWKINLLLIKPTQNLPVFVDQHPVLISRILLFIVIVIFLWCNILNHSCPLFSFIS